MQIRVSKGFGIIVAFLILGMSLVLSLDKGISFDAANPITISIGVVILVVMLSFANVKRRNEQIKHFMQKHAFKDLRDANTLYPAAGMGRVLGEQKRGDETWYLTKEQFGSGKHQRYRTTFIVGWEKILPIFSASRENKLDELFGKDIDFEEDQAFSQAVLLRSEEEMGVKKLFTPRLRQIFIASPKRFRVRVIGIPKGHTSPIPQRYMDKAESQKGFLGVLHRGFLKSVARMGGDLANSNKFILISGNDKILNSKEMEELYQWARQVVKEIKDQ